MVKKYLSLIKKKNSFFFTLIPISSSRTQLSVGEQRPLTWRCSVQFSAVSQQQDELQQEEDKVTHLFQVSLSIAHARPFQLRT